MSLAAVSNNLAAPLAQASASSAPGERGKDPSAPSIPVQATRAQPLRQAVAAANKFIEAVASNLEFQIDERSGRTIMKLIDRETGSIIRQLPTEEMLAIARTLDKLQGLVIHLKA